MMKTIICRCCAMEYALPEGAKVAACPACAALNTAFAAPVAALQRAHRQRQALDYAGAEASYLRVLDDDPDCHEALWGLVLCHYGVEFVEDQPLVHFPRRIPVAKNADFRRACEVAPEEMRTQYEATARQVDALLAELNKRAAKAPAYDVYLCHKTTAADGSGFCEDYRRAATLYHVLTKMGLRVFFAPECLSAASGADYAAALLNAQRSARAMLLICSEPANIKSAWVRSEWTGFLEMMDAGADKRLIPLLYGGMRAGQLPREILLRGIQALNMEELTALDQLRTLLR